MNGLGIEGVIQGSDGGVKRSIPKHHGATVEESTGNQENSLKPITGKREDGSQNDISPELAWNPTQIPGEKKRHRHHGHKRTHETYDEQDEDQSSIHQPT
jgi:hypothetical protein